MKNFDIEWKKNEKYGNEVIRTNRIVADKAQTAVSLFMQTFGNLKKNDIIQVQEIGINGEPVGEPIIPN
jgi:hypothetical protein